MTSTNGRRSPSDIKESKLKNGRTYHWFVKHEMWTLQKAEDCKFEKTKNDTKKVADEIALQSK